MCMCMSVLYFEFLVSVGCYLSSDLENLLLFLQCCEDSKIHLNSQILRNGLDERSQSPALYMFITQQQFSYDRTKQLIKGEIKNTP